MAAPLPLQPPPVSVQPPSREQSEEDAQSHAHPRSPLPPDFARFPPASPLMPSPRLSVSGSSGSLNERIAALRHPRPLLGEGGSSNAFATDPQGDLAVETRSARSTSSSPRRQDELPRRRPLRAYSRNSEAIEEQASSFSSTSPSAANSAVLAHNVLDALQLPISHLLHILPPQMLESCRESLSPSSLPIPVTTIEAMMEAFRSINWICDAFVKNAKDAKASDGEESVKASLSDSTLSPDEYAESPLTDTFPPIRRKAFDVFALAQRAADVVAGQAASKSIDLTLSLNGLIKAEGISAGMQALAVGDESAVRHVLIHALSRIVELAPDRSTVGVAMRLSSNAKGKVREGGFPCSFVLSLLPPAHYRAAQHSEFWTPDERVLEFAKARWTILESRKQDGYFSAQLGFADLHISSRDMEEQLSTPMEEVAGSIAGEPTPFQLAEFASQELQGKNVAIHAEPGGTFAQDLAELLQVCGCHVSRVAVPSPGQNSPVTTLGTGSNLPVARTAIAMAGGRPAFVRYTTDFARGLSTASAAAAATPGTAVLDPVTGVPLTVPDATIHAVSDPKEVQQAVSKRSQEMARDASNETIKGVEAPEPIPKVVDAFSFIMIDDDVEVLQNELLRLRSALPLLQGALGQGTPRIPLHNRTTSYGFPGDAPNAQSSENEKRSKGLTQAIVYFTSLKNLRLAREIINPIMYSAMQAVDEQAARLLPEIVVVPKPAGARRTLTALRSAVYKTRVEEPFSAIASTPAWNSSGDSGFTRELKDSGESSRASQTPALPKASSQPLTPSRERPLKLPTLPLPDAAALTSSNAPSSGDADSHPGRPSAEYPNGSSPIARSPQQRRASADKSPGNPYPPSVPASVRSSHGSSSPMPVEALEYFSETAARMGGTGASGMMIQSPDGRPAALFFDPQLSFAGPRSLSRRSTASNQTAASRPKMEERGASYRRRPTEASRNADSRSQRSISEVFGNAGPKDTTLIQSPPKSPSLAAPEMSRASSNASSAKKSRPKLRSLETDNTNASVASHATSWKDAVPGTIFTPQVGIDHVLASGRLPLATPIAPSSNTETSSNSSAHSSTSASHASERQHASPRSRVSSREEALSSRRGPQNAATDEKPPQSQQRPVDPERQPSKAQNPTSGTEPASPTKPTVSDKTPREPFNPPPEPEQAPRDPVQHPSFVHASAVNRPSAQPQSGLLIGAGFQSSARRGIVAKKQQVREKVLPPIKVLIVEDNPINQRIMKQFMTKRKIQFEVAGNGREAVDKWSTGGFHLILMDIQLPVMDGIEATKEIRRQELSSNVGVLPATPPVTTSTSASAQKQLHDAVQANNTVPSTPFRASVIIVALTASVLNSDRVAALAAGCNDFLNKPVSLQWLEKKIIEWGSMQYILLSGAGVFDAERRAQRIAGGATQREQGALAAAAANDADLRKAFGRAPDAQAKLLASRLHLPAKRANSPKLLAQAAMASAKSNAMASQSNAAPSSTTAEEKSHPVNGTTPAAAAAAGGGGRGDGGAGDGGGSEGRPEVGNGNGKASE